MTLIFGVMDYGSVEKHNFSFVLLCLTSQYVMLALSGVPPPPLAKYTHVSTIPALWTTIMNDDVRILNILKIFFLNSAVLEDDKQRYKFQSCVNEGLFLLNSFSSLQKACFFFWARCDVQITNAIFKSLYGDVCYIKQFVSIHDINWLLKILGL